MGQCATSSSADASAGEASASDVVLSRGDESPDGEQDGLRRDASQARKLALDVAVGAALEVGEQLPLVGGFVKLLGKVRDIYGELDEKVQEAEEVAVWASRTLTVVRPIQVRLSKRGANGPIDDTMQALVTDVAKTVGELLVVAKHISSGSKPSSFLRTALFRSEFDEAKAAFDLTMKELDTALGVDTNITVHEVKGDTTEILKKLEMLMSLIDAMRDADADKKTTLRALVDMVRASPARNQAVLVDVTEKVVDGDSDGAAAALAAAPADVQESIAAIYAEGVALYQQDKWSEAIVAFQKCVELDPENSRAWFALGNVLCKVRKDYDGAERHFRKAIELDPSVEAYNGLGVVLMRRKDYEGAEKHCRKAIELYPNSAKAHCNLGNTLHSLQRYDGAEKMYRKAIELDPSDATSCWNLMVILEKQRNDIPGAIEAVEEYIRRGDPGNDGEQRLAKLRAAATPAGKAYSEGLARKNEKNWPEAVAAFQNCVALDENHSEAWFWLGYALEQRDGKLSEASYEPYTRCIALTQSCAAAHHNLGNLLKSVRKDYDGAELHYRKVIELDPNLGEGRIWWGLSDCLEKKNDIPGAIEAVEEYIRRGDPNNDGEQRLKKLRAAATPAGKAYSEGLARKNEKKWPEAIAAYRKAIELDPSDAVKYNSLADALMNYGDLREAELIICTAIKMDGKYAIAHYTFSEILEKQNDIPGAVKQMEECVRLGGIPGFSDGEQELATLREKLSLSLE